MNDEKLALGVLGLDTSHPEAFAELLADRQGVSVSAVWDAGTVREVDYVDSFCEKYGATRYDDPDAMVDAVDGAMVLTVDWDHHPRLAERFLRSSVPTLIDKPLAGNLEDVASIVDAAADTALFGGSAVPFHPSLDHLPRGGDARTLFAAGYNDYYYYRVHISDVARRLAAASWSVVEPTDDPGTTIRVSFVNGVHAILRFDGSPSDGAFGVLDVSDRTHAVEIPSGGDDFEALYRPYLDAFIECVRGNRDDTEVVADAARLGLAIETTLEHDCRVTPDSDRLAATAVGDDAFVADYEPYY